jgi:hypothetical protein
MTGAFLRVQRDGKWQNLEVEHLTDCEREKKLKNDPSVLSWLHLVCNELARVEGILKQLEADGVLEVSECENVGENVGEKEVSE